MLSIESFTIIDMNLLQEFEGVHNFYRSRHYSWQVETRKFPDPFDAGSSTVKTKD
jgi:hypothetical protein